MLHIYLCIALVQQVILIWHDMLNEHINQSLANARKYLDTDANTNWNEKSQNNNKKQKKTK